jgi:hypothetical protein
MKTVLRSSLFLLLATTAFAIPAQAEEVPPVVDAIIKSWETQFKEKPSYEKIDADGDGNVTITNLTANTAADGASPGMKLTISTIILEGVEAEADGLIEVATATFSGSKAEISGPDNQNFTVEMPEGTAEDWYVPVKGDNPTPKEVFRASMSLAKKIKSGELKIMTMGQTITSDGYETTWDGDPATGAGKFTMTLGNVVIPEGAIAAMDPTGQLKQLGYSSLTLSASGDGELTVTDDTFSFSANIGFASEDLAGFKMAFGASDMPMAAAAEMRASRNEGRPPNFNALMPQLMNVSLGNFQFRFEDDSITKKVLPMIAKMQGMDEAAMVANAGAMMQIGLLQLKNQAFTDQVVGAVNAFLKDPKSFTVSLKPAAPVKVQQLMMLNPANPGAAIDVLGVSVTAND